jgi:hypothetical protein
MMPRLFLALFMVGCTSATLARADQIFTTPPGAVVPGGPVSAFADFSLSGTTLTVTLSSTLAEIHDAGQLLTDVLFSLSDSGSPSLASQTADLILVDGSGVVTDLGISPLGWGFGTFMSGFELCVICQGTVTAPATPSQGILGPPSADGRYDNANSSIAGNGPHNPFVNQTATFTITGVPSDAVVGDVSFSFSTVPGVNVPGTPTPPIPEPASILLLGTVLVGLGRFASKLRA